MGDFREYSPCLQSQVLKVTRDHPPGSYSFGVLSFQASVLCLLRYCFHLFHFFFWGGGAFNIVTRFCFLVIVQVWIDEREMQLSGYDGCWRRGITRVDSVKGFLYGPFLHARGGQQS